MTGYGGATRSFGDNAGGYMPGSQQGGSQGGDKRTAHYDKLRPVTIKQLLEAEFISDKDVRIDGTLANQVTFVGQIREIKVQQTHVFIRLDDGTGMIDVRKFDDRERLQSRADSLSEDMYVRIGGRVNNYNNKIYFAGSYVRPIADYNEVSFHMLEAAYVHLYHTQGAGPAADSLFVSGVGDSAAAAAATAGLGLNTSSKLTGRSPGARSVYDCIQRSNTNEGVNINLIVSETGMSASDVSRAANELVDNGFIFPTVDDETWALLEF